MATFIDRHRGPFRFLAGRPHPKKKGHFTSELLKGSIESADVLEEAKALLTDPRDTIIALSVWCEKDEQFIGTITKESVDKLLANSYSEGEF